MKFLPYSFKGVKHFLIKRPLSNPEILLAIGNGYFQQYNLIFTNVLKAMADNDQSYLKRVMEPTIFKQTKKGLDQLSKENHYLKYYEEAKGTKALGEDDNVFSYTKPTYPYVERDMRINFNMSFVRGVYLNRQLNLYPIQIRQNRYIDLRNPFKNKKIIVAQVEYKTTRRLWLMNKKDQIIQGNKDITKWIYHRFIKWRFEKCPKDGWLITDIDDYLKGNPY